MLLFQLESPIYIPSVSLSLLFEKIFCIVHNWKLLSVCIFHIQELSTLSIVASVNSIFGKQKLTFPN